ncbi:hypothetical protein N7455_004851, partial [Penicillium solitum]|uniref:uncharacterized protein n=1 Tax=Penicillium solitum TaxID=60172 RepID=UPI0032C449E7
IACVWLAGGYNVNLRYLDETQITAARQQYIEEHILSQAVEIAWLVIESVPERLELKKLVFEELSKLQQQIAFWVLIRPLLNRASCWKIWMPQLDVGV